jgi:ribonuclease E
MTKRMLIDATHAEETRVVVLDGNRLEDFDVETSTKRQLKGNIYLAKVVRVEPSLQAAFVEYGGNRHGFLAFSEIHPDYYQIPVADRQRLIDQEAEEAQREEEEVDRELEGEPHPFMRREQSAAPAPIETGPVETGPVETGPVETGPVETGPVETGPVETGPVETGDESDATAEMLRDNPPDPEPQSSAPNTQATLAAQSDSVVGSTTTAPADDATIQAGSAVPAGGLGGRVSGAAALAPADDAAEPADTTALPAGDLGNHVSGAAAVAPIDAAPEVAVPVPPPADTTPPEPKASLDAAPEHATSDHLEPDHDAPGHNDEPEPPTRRAQPMVIDRESVSGPVETGTGGDDSDALTLNPADAASEADTEHEPGYDDSESIPESPPPETVGGEPDSADEQRERRPPSRYLRNYKIQEVIRRRQILLVQVVKEERGTKGAALTTYLSLAGRFCVLMPNSPRGGGISRKITSAADRRRLKEVVAELEMPKGMGLIVRTAGANRPKPEIKRDCEYLLRLWDDIREHTLKSVAPALIYEEASLIKRAIRDVYSRDIDEIQVDGEEGWRAAHEFMRMLMPSHAKKVQLWRDPSQPLFAKYQVEAQLDGMLQPTVQLRSGGYLVINQTEALVAIDVNSGRSTRERNVEETALRTNLEAVDEVARQLRLRDLAGLIVIDLIDMEQKKHNSMVERRIKEALKNDRARIQVGHISHFGLLEMSRQRLRPSLAEASFILCPHCGGTGHVRSTENAAIHVLRGIEDEGSKRRAAEVVVHAATPISLYILNHKRERLGEIERRYAMRVTVMGDDTQVASEFRIDRMRPQVAREDALVAITPDAPPALPAPRWEPEEAEDIAVEDEPDLDEAGGDEGVAEASGDDENGAEEPRDGARTEGPETAEQAERRRRRRRRRRGGRREEGSQSLPAEAASGALVTDADTTPEHVRTDPAVAAADDDIAPQEMHIEGVPEHPEPANDEDARRRRGRRGGRRRRREPGDGEGSPFAAPGAEQPDLPPVYAGPTPANPFGGHAFDIFDVLEQVEASASVRQESVEVVARQSQPEPEAVPEAGARVEAGAGVEARTVAESTAEPASAAALAESESLAATAGPEAPAAASALEIANATAPEPATVEAKGEPAANQPLVEAAPAEPTAPATSPEPPPPEVANDAAPEPAIKPIIIGSGEEPAQKKRGWWRR